MFEYGSFWPCPVTRSATGPPKIARRISDDDHDAPDESGLVLLETSPEELTRASAGDGQLRRGGCLDRGHGCRQRRTPNTARV